MENHVCFHTYRFGILYLKVGKYQSNQSHTINELIIHRLCCKLFHYIIVTSFTLLFGVMHKSEDDPFSLTV